MKQNGRTYIGTAVHGYRSILKGDNSSVKLEIPKGLFGTIKCCIHTDIAPFLSQIPQSECLVAPIPEYHFTKSAHFQREEILPFRVLMQTPFNKMNKATFRLRHGDIYNSPKKAFDIVQKEPMSTDICCYSIEDGRIVIMTRTFSQFICTSCQKVCNAGARAFIFGGITKTPARIYTNIRVYLCGYLFKLDDFKMVIYFYFLYH